MPKRFRRKIAKSLDADEVFSVLREVSGKIPLALDTEEVQETLLGSVRKLCGNGVSLIASSDGQVIGFLLAKLDEYRCFQDRDQRQWLHICYIGVTKNWRRKGPFPALMADIMALGLPLSAEVKHANKSGMAKKLVDCFGFRMEGPSPKEGDYFIWEPAA